LGRAVRAQTTGSFCGCPSEDTLTALPHEISRRGVGSPSEIVVSASAPFGAHVCGTGSHSLHGALLIGRARPTAAV